MDILQNMGLSSVKAEKFLMEQNLKLTNEDAKYFMTRASIGDWLED